MRSLLVLPVLVAVGYCHFPCADFGSDIYGEISCLRRELNRCNSQRTTRESRTATNSPPMNASATLSSASSSSSLRTTVPSTLRTTIAPPPPTVPAAAAAAATVTTPRPTVTPLPTKPLFTTPIPAMAEVEASTEASDDWPTPNSALIIDALKYELTREIEVKIRESNEKFDKKMASYQVQVEQEMKKLDKEMRLMKLKVHRNGAGEYILSEERESWYIAGEICTRWGGHLVSVKDAAENSFVSGLIPTGDAAWIGLNDVQREDVFVNADGARTTYRKWEAGQPDNMHHNENCVEVLGGGEGRWRDSLCLLTKRFVCRRY